MRKDNRQKISKVVKMIVLLFVIVGVMWLALLVGVYIANRKHGQVFVARHSEFVESARYLDNPNRGFYRMYGFMISDEQAIDYQSEVSDRMKGLSNTSIAMVTINLQKYSCGSISWEGLENIDKLFHALSNERKDYVIRFLYDWSGENLEVEPQSIDIITTHMKQLQPIFHKYKDIIFLHQGIFIGDCGEMHTTKHMEHMKKLAAVLQSVIHENTFMSVRTPAQWRQITQIADPNMCTDRALPVYRIGLFNDGMMGSYSDYGTYGNTSREIAGDNACWTREEELAFQDELCKYVPNGGEVIIDNEYNDFENALSNLKTMHITYLNRDYDQDVLNKWADSIICDNSVYNGMDGLTYIERHLGYRFVLREASMDYQYAEDVLNVKVTVQNVGFAPIYKDTEMYMVLENKESGDYIAHRIPGELNGLTGGNQSQELLDVYETIALEGMEAGEYSIYFYVEDCATNQKILFANEQDIRPLGYWLGTIVVEPLKNPITKEEIEIPNRIKKWLEK